MTFTRLAARAVHVVQLISTTDSRATERLCVLLTASNGRHCIAHMYAPYPAVVDVCRFSKERNTAFEQ